MIMSPFIMFVRQHHSYSINLDKALCKINFSVYFIKRHLDFELVTKYFFQFDPYNLGCILC